MKYMVGITVCFSLLQLWHTIRLRPGTHLWISWYGLPVVQQKCVIYNITKLIFKCADLCSGTVKRSLIIRCRLTIVAFERIEETLNHCASWREQEIKCILYIYIWNLQFPDNIIKKKHYGQSPSGTDNRSRFWITCWCLLVTCSQGFYYLLFQSFSMSLPDDGYSRNAFQKRWRLL